MNSQATNIFRRLALPMLAAVALFAGASAASAQSTINFVATNATITNSDPTQNGRLFRDANPSVYTTNKAFPGTTGLGTAYHFDEYVFTNTNAFAEPVFITLSTTSFTLLPFSVAYLTYFNPTDISVNYRGDSGSSPVGSSISYSILVPANTGFDIVVNEVTAGGGVPSYTLTVSTSVPEPSAWALLGFGTVAVGAGLLRRRALAS